MTSTLALADAGVLSAFTEFVRRHEALLGWAAGSSVVVCVGSLFLLPWLAARIPPDYFARDHAPALPFADAHPAVALVARIARNVAGLVLTFLGILMLVLPGQGLLTILAGLMLLEFPGKRRLEIALIRRPAVHRSLNWLRAKAGRGPLTL